MYRLFCYDPWNAQSFITTIESMALDWPLIEVGQSFKALSQSIKEFRMWVADERIQHNDNMLLTTSVNNAVLIRDGEDNVKINKKMNRQKIDPIISIITAFTEARMHEFQEKLDNMKAKNSDFKGGDKMDLNKINVFFNFLVANLVSILFY